MINKKAGFFTLGLLIVFIGAMLFAYSTILAKQASWSDDNSVSYNIKDIMNLWSDHYLNLNYIRQTAQLSAPAVIKNYSYYLGAEKNRQFYGPFPLITKDNFTNYKFSFSDYFNPVFEKSLGKTSNYYETLTPTHIYGLESKQEFTVSQKKIDFKNYLEPKSNNILLPIKNSNVITSCFGTRTCVGCSKTHKGIDFRTTYGNEIRAVKSGIVTFAGGDYGTVVIDHKDGTKTRYLHNSMIKVHVGEFVPQGYVIALSGGKGPKGPTQYPVHLHFEFWIGNKKVNPACLYPGKLYFKSDPNDCGTTANPTPILGEYKTCGYPNYITKRIQWVGNHENYFDSSEIQKKFEKIEQVETDYEAPNNLVLNSNNNFAIKTKTYLENFDYIQKNTNALISNCESSGDILNCIKLNFRKLNQDTDYFINIKQSDSTPKLEFEYSNNEPENYIDTRSTPQLQYSPINSGSDEVSTPDLNQKEQITTEKYTKPFWSLNPKLSDYEKLLSTKQYLESCLTSLNNNCYCPVDKFQLIESKIISKEKQLFLTHNSFNISLNVNSKVMSLTPQGISIINHKQLSGKNSEYVCRMNDSYYPINLNRDDLDYNFVLSIPPKRQLEDLDFTTTKIGSNTLLSWKQPDNYNEIHYFEIEYAGHNLVKFDPYPYNDKINIVENLIPESLSFSLIYFDKSENRYYALMPGTSPQILTYFDLWGNKRSFTKQILLTT